MLGQALEVDTNPVQQDYPGVDFACFWLVSLGHKSNQLLEDLE